MTSKERRNLVFCGGMAVIWAVILLMDLYLIRSGISIQSFRIAAVFVAITSVLVILVSLCGVFRIWAVSWLQKRGKG